MTQMPPIIERLLALALLAGLVTLVAVFGVLPFAEKARTDKFHARGPCGLRELTSYKYVVQGTGQLRIEV